MNRHPIYALSNTGLPSFDVWQRSIDDLDLLFAVRLLSVEVGAGGFCAMRLGHLSTRFTCVSATPGSLPAGRGAGTLRSYTHAYGFDDCGKHIESTAAKIACVSLVLATGGALFRVGLEPETEIAWARRDLDFELAYDLRREDAYFDRYPEERQAGDRPQADVGQMKLAIILHQESQK